MQRFGYHVLMIAMLFVFLAFLYINISTMYYSKNIDRSRTRIYTTSNRIALNNTNTMKTAFQNITLPKLQKPIKQFRTNFCDKKYGKIAIVTLLTAGNYKNVVSNALISVKCYAKMRGYDLYQIEHDGVKITSGYNDLTIVDKCKATSLMAIRHCIIANILPNYDYIIHLDGDSGVVNPDHCFEEYITPGRDIYFLERVHSGEIQAGHYIVKNTEYAKNFLLNWFKQANISQQSDNTILLKQFAKLILSKVDSIKCLKQTGWNLMLCIKKSMKGKRVLENVQLYRRAHAFVRDAWTTNFLWSDKDFLLHALKRKDDVVFSRKLNIDDCNSSFWYLPIKEHLYVNMTTMKKEWRRVDDTSFNKLAIDQKDISSCWPNCSDNL